MTNSHPYHIAEVPGLTYVPDYLNPTEQQRLVNETDRQTWRCDLQRRVQHYCYRYDYTRRNVDTSMYLGPLPEWVAPFIERLTQEGYISQYPDQMIINEYQPGQGIAAHIDCKPCFGNTVLSISLGSSCVMEFTHGGTKQPILLQPGSLTVMTEAARNKWKHGIPARKSDVHNGQKHIRQRRLSLTFRTVLL